MSTDNMQSRATSDGDSIAAAILNALSAPDRDERTRAIDEAAHMADPEELIAAVADHTDSIRRNAALSALTRADRRSVPTLIRALHHEDPEVVMFAATVLGKTRDRSAIPPLIRLLHYPDTNVAQAAMESLASLRATAAVEAIVETMSRDPWLLFAGIHALGEIGSPRATPVLVPLLHDESTRELAASALGKIRSVAALDHLAGLLCETVDTESFMICLRALGSVLERCGDARTLHESEAWGRLSSGAASGVHLRLLEVLARGPTTIGQEDLEAKVAAAMLIRALRLRPLYTPMVLAGRDPDLQEPLQFCAVAIGDEIAASLDVGMTYENANVRVLACRCAGAIRLHELAGRITRLLLDPVPEVRKAAIEALAQMGRQEAAPSLVHLLLDPVEEVQDAARAALSRADAELATEALLSHPDRSPEFCDAALRVMRLNPHADQLGFILDCLGSPLPRVRRLAVTSLVEQPTFDYVEAVHPLLSDPDVRVRHAVISALARRPSRRVRSLLLDQLHRDLEMRLDAARALAETGDPSVTPHLLELFGEESTPGRLAIVEGLAEFRDPAAEPVLVALLSDDDAEVRRAAIQSLGKFGTRTALRHIVAAATDEDASVRTAVVQILTHSTDPSAVAELEKMCLDENAQVATLARHHLELLGGDR